MSHLAGGFFLGVFAGRLIYLDWLRVHFGAGIAAILFFFTMLLAFRGCSNSSTGKTIFRAVLLCAGVFWGLFNSAPVPGRQIAAEVLRVNFNLGAAPALVMAADGHVYEVSLAGPLESSGFIKVWRRPAVFSSRRAVLNTLHNAAPVSLSRWALLADEARQHFTSIVEGYGPTMAAWLRSAILGLPSNLSPRLSHAFRRTGLLHIVVVSGSHVTMVAMGILSIFATPFRLAYGFRFINPKQWIRFSLAIKIFVVAWVLFFCTVVGASHAAQRAVLGFVVLQGSRMLWGDVSVFVRLKWTLAAQILVFPIGFLCESTVMSWLAYLMVVEYTSAPIDGGWLSKTIRLQVVLSILMGAMCGQWSLLGILTNLVLIPVIPVVFGFGVLLMFPGLFPNAVKSLALGIQDKFLQIVCWVSEVTAGLPFMVVDFTTKDLWLRYLVLMLGVTIVLNSWALMSIRPTSTEVELV